MKFSYRQILASAAGAVIAALIASSFGVTGTIVGVAIGSMAATMGTALVSQSIERGHKVVKQAVVRVPEGSTPTLLRRMGGNRAAGKATSSVEDGAKGPDLTEIVGAVGGAITEMEAATASVNVPATERLAAPAIGEESRDPAAERVEPTTAPLPPTAVSEGAGVVGVTGGEGVAAAADPDVAERERRFTWKAFAATAAIVFALALGFVTAVELIANRPSIITPSSPAPPATTTTAPSASTTSTSTSTPGSTTTSTTAGPGTTTSTTAAGTTTTTTNVARSTTTTTATAP